MIFNKQLLSILTILTIISILTTETLLSGCSNKQVKTIDSTEVKVPVLDSNDNGDISRNLVYDISEALSNTKDSLNKTKDSIRILTNKIVAINYTKDSIIKVYKINKEQLSIAQYKLLRIKYYNDVAAKGNNLKFLRGWIIRTLK